MRPLFVKYQTKTGNHYVYDVRTGEILSVSDVVHEILDDYHLLTPGEICEKHLALGKDTIREALAELDQVQEQGVLCDHAPEIAPKVESACSEGKPESLRDFIGHRRRQMTLELTHRCNLACEYCIFGKHYPQTRETSGGSMSLGTAKRAVTRFISHKPKKATIGFYGGEPFLEFELIKEIVAFAEKLGAENGVELQFNVTTNGTLLSEEKIHFLVAHNFSVMISLDGNRESHDRYRVFNTPGRKGERRGSFDVVIRNMERFVQLYPDYQGRGIVLTLTASANYPEVEEFVRHWKPSFPAFVARTVYPVQGRVEAAGGGHSIEFGECQTLACMDESCVRRNPHSEPPGEVPEFDDWSTESVEAMGAGIANLVSKLRQNDNVMAARQACEDSPISESLLESNMRRIHKRAVVVGAGRKLSGARMPCFPGAVRTYYSSAGAVFPCERVEFGKLFEIGDATGDVDPDKVCDTLVEAVRVGCDCGNCIVKQVCVLCPALLTESRESPGDPDFLALQRTCRQMALEPVIAARLKGYTELMEANPEVCDWLYPENSHGEHEDWLNNVIVMAKEREDVELTVEELEEWV